jgi:hypothetical protein
MNNKMKKGLLFFLWLLTWFAMPIQADAQGVVPVTIYVETAGTLPTLIAASEKYQITDLTLTGNLNGTDIRYIREMAGRDSIGNATNGKLAILNLAGANIISGGDYYYYDYGYSNDYYTTETNTISEYMFYECTGLTNVTIPISVTNIGVFSFGSCTGLTGITIPTGLLYIGGWAFIDCSNLTNVIIPNSVIIIDDSAFEDCTGLTSVTVPNSVTYIGSSVFAGCRSITSITIPNGIESIESSTFRECSNLTSVTIPNSVTNIGASSFRDCTGLTSVTIGNSVTNIEDDAFDNCTNLKEIYSKNPTPPGTDRSFPGVNNTTCKVYVPKGSYNAYRSAPEWCTFVNIIEENSTSINFINKNNILIYPVSTGISIETKEMTPVSIFNISGQKVFQSQINGNKEINLYKGIYIVKANSESQKILVK